MLKETLDLAPDGKPFHIIRLNNEAGMRIALMDWGATWLSCQMPVADSLPRELILGCHRPIDYLTQTAYLGATVGRYANRIAHARLYHGDRPIILQANQGAHQLHGGENSFSHRRWEIINHNHSSVTFRLYSTDGDNGYPGNLVVEVAYALTENNRVNIHYCATVDRECPLNMTNHAYFNLDGVNQDARLHRLQIDAEQFLPVNRDGIPDGELTAVEGRGMDFRQPKTLMQDFLKDKEQRKVNGYDHAFLLSQRCLNAERPAAHLWSTDNSVRLSVFTTKPALQLYSGNFLQGTPARDGGTYENFSGIALETQFLPDSPNRPEWPQPNCWLKPHQTYRYMTAYQFDLI